MARPKDYYLNNGTVRVQTKKTMLEFKKYSSIENSFNKEFMEHIEAEMPMDLVYVVQEKVHGANSSFLCDGSDVQFAKRTAVLGKEEQFYDYEQLVSTYKDKILRLFERIKVQHPQLERVNVFGEMFGGQYPHKEVVNNPKISLIQKGIYYCPSHEFYGFDIYITENSIGKYLDVEEVDELFEAEGFLYAKTLFKGNLEECLNYPNLFQTHIPEWLGLPPIEGNTCEGVVIRPVTPMYFKNGSRVLIKNKNEKFSEKKQMKKRIKEFDVPVQLSESLTRLMPELEAYVTENRLTNVISHIGEIQIPRDIAKVMGNFSKDVLEDFLKEYHEQYNALEKDEQKRLKKQLNKLATDLVKNVYMRRNNMKK